jgi:hypothetical protein
MPAAKDQLHSAKTIKSSLQKSRTQDVIEPYKFYLQITNLFFSSSI